MKTRQEIYNDFINNAFDDFSESFKEAIREPMKPLIRKMLEYRYYEFAVRLNEIKKIMKKIFITVKNIFKVSR